MSDRQSASDSRTGRDREKPRLVIELFGPLAIRYGERDVIIVGRKARALIGYLALSDRLEETRDSIVGLLWGESDQDHARGSLRQALAEVRRALKAVDFDGLRADRLSIGFDRASVSVDLADVIESARAGEAHAILLERERAADSVLSEFETVDDDFGDWLRAKRQSIANNLIRMLEKVMHDEGVAAPKRRRAAQALLNLEPSNEVAARLLIRAALAAGDNGAAFTIYDQLRTLLRDIYGVKPSAETEDIIASVLQAQDEAAVPKHRRLPARTSGDVAHPLAVTPPRSRLKLVVSVMPFDMSKVSVANLYRVQGFRRELVAHLVRFREWVVSDRALAANPDRPPQPEQTEYLIEASAIETRNEVRLTLTLREAGETSYLWSEPLKLAVESWFQAQERVVRRLSTSLNLHISAERLAAIAQRGPNNLIAYDLWLLAQATLSRLEASSWERASVLLKEVIRQSPNFAPAFSSLAQLNNSAHIAMPGIMRDRTRTDAALGFAREAARIDPADSRSQLCLGWSHAMAKQYEQAIIHMLLANELNENDSWTTVSSANCLAFCAEYDKAREIAVRALSLPLAPSPLQWSYQAAIRFMLADYEGCVAAAEAAGDSVNPNVPAWKTAALFHLGETAEAEAQLKRFFSLTRERWSGAEPASDAAITRWLLQMFPIRRKDDWLRLRDGLAGAGAPVGNLVHHGW